ncbi:hypothetical protein [Pseudoxanthomonas dokdonensis]|uniref:Pathogenicity-like protein n=1 Tax=Pseudoxanthomonas dokdonensis TaxID=344882 RepID=A0A0R0CWT2_9GAMM|nr:hypothetical protein [Pseudoxanthomonas dokdonensis]KRG69811.1 pathogenicity-like protein [Pseudoxanthomonas dokdonensis]
MRQIFTSQRIETVEGVARLLTDAGIEVHISNGRSYQSKRNSQFSFTDPVPAGLQPGLWVRHAEDQPRAREILREAGLLESTRPGAGASLTFRPPQDEAPTRRNWAWWIRGLLLIIIAAAAYMTFTRHRGVPSSPAESPASQPAPAEPASEDESVRVQVKPASG